MVAEEANKAQGPPPALGTLLMSAGGLLLALGIIDHFVGIPFWMPRSWFSNRPLWYFLAVGCIVAGGALLRNRGEAAESSLPTGRAFRGVRIYSRGGCHLCEEAKEVLLRYARYLPEIEEVDVDADPHWQQEYGDCVPVVEIDGKVRFRGRVNEILLRRLIEGAGAEP